jgi:hypothetical protein
LYLGREDPRTQIYDPKLNIYMKVVMGYQLTREELS